MGKAQKQLNNKNKGLEDMAGLEAMEVARIKQNEEIAAEQARMERMHVATMALSGLLAREVFGYEEATKLAISYADALLKALMK